MTEDKCSTSDVDVGDDDVQLLAECAEDDIDANGIITKHNWLYVFYLGYFSSHLQPF